MFQGFWALQIQIVAGLVPALIMEIGEFGRLCTTETYTGNSESINRTLVGQRDGDRLVECLENGTS